MRMKMATGRSKIKILLIEATFTFLVESDLLCEKKLQNQCSRSNWVLWETRKKREWERKGAYLCLRVSVSAWEWKGVCVMERKREGVGAWVWALEIEMWVHVRERAFVCVWYKRESERLIEREVLAIHFGRPIPFPGTVEKGRKRPFPGKSSYMFRNGFSWVSQH